MTPRSFQGTVLLKNKSELLCGLAARDERNGLHGIGRVRILLDLQLLMQR